MFSPTCRDSSILAFRIQPHPTAICPLCSICSVPFVPLRTVRVRYESLCYLICFLLFARRTAETCGGVGGSFPLKEAHKTTPRNNLGLKAWLSCYSVRMARILAPRTSISTPRGGRISLPCMMAPRIQILPGRLNIFNGSYKVWLQGLPTSG